GHANVRRLTQRIRQREPLVLVRVVQGESLVVTLLAEHAVTQRGAAQSEQRRDRARLDRRAGLVRYRDAAPVARAVLTAAAHCGQNLARARICHHQLAAARTVRLHRLGERGLGYLLKIVVDGEVYITPGDRLERTQHRTRQRTS